MEDPIFGIRTSDPTTLGFLVAVLEFRPALDRFIPAAGIGEKDPTDILWEE